MKCECVIFDMDGTLTQASLDFNAIRAEMGLGPEEDILGGLAAMSPARRDEAERVLLAHEMRAAELAEPNEGACEVVRRLGSAGVAVALLTRNTRPAMQTVLRRLGLSFDLAWAREDGPIKPSPVSILSACGRLNVSPARTACVGDWVFDIQAANAAGCVSILLARGRELEFASQARFVIHRLAELETILEL